MAVYNGSPFLRTAIDSILQQTYSDFHFLIVDDASSDDSRDIVRDYDDPRIELLCLENNLGQAGALNAGLRHASTPWVARMDADDYSAPTRLEEQMRMLDEDSSLRCVGTFAWIFHDDPQEFEGLITTPLDHEEIRRAVSGSPIIHGTIIVDRDALLEVGAYDERLPISADVDMYDRLLPKYKAATLPKPLLGVRRHAGQGSNSRAAFDENVQITRRRLASKHFSPAQTSVIRADLARNHLYRSRLLISEKRPAEAMKDIVRAFQASPKTFLWGSIKVFLVYNMSERSRARIKRWVARIGRGSKCH